MIAKAVRENLRQKRGDHAVNVGDADAESDQREHVQTAVHDRMPGADKERPATPKHDRCRKRELKPTSTCVGRAAFAAGSPGIRSLMPMMSTGNERTTDTQKRRFISVNSVVSVFESYGARFERHAADRAEPGASRMISGCIGHVYSIFSPAAGAGAAISWWSMGAAPP